MKTSIATKQVDSIVTRNKQVNMRRLMQILCMVMAMMIVFSMLSVCAFATDGTSDAGDAIEKGIKNGTEKIYNIIKAVVTPIAVVILALNVVKMLMGSEREIQSAKHMALICIIAIAVVWLAPAIISQVASWFSSSGDAGVFS